MISHLPFIHGAKYGVFGPGTRRIQLHQEAHAENHPVLATKNET
jgi:hypothetical protein